LESGMAQRMNAYEIPMTILQVASVPLLVLLNGFFVAAEFALVKIRDTQLEALVSRGHRRAKVARRIVHNLDAALSATQLGVTLASLGLGWVGKPVFASLLAPVLKQFNIDPVQADWIAFAVGFTVITFLHIVAGELAPKSLAIQKPLATSLWVAQPLHWFYLVFYPVIWVLNHGAFWLLRRLGLQPASEAELSHSEEEIRLLLAETRRHASGPTLGQDIALNAFALRLRRVREVMRPRQEIVALNTEDSIAECLALARRTRYSRFPLCEGGDLDKTLGVVNSKDLADVRHEAERGRDLVAVARKIIFVPETARLEKLLTLFLQRKLHLALVVDEYGGTVGLVTLENVLEELVGPIEDEFDEEEPLIQQTGEQAWELNGSLPAHKVAELTGGRIELNGGVSTVTGLVTQRMGRFPRKGDVVALDFWDLRVKETNGTQAVRLELAPRLRQSIGCWHDQDSSQKPACFSQGESSTTEAEVGHPVGMGVEGRGCSKVIGGKPAVE
jgi:CBS domain containing-hemolysin-like protein